jgi:hypothetical protein
MGPLVRTKRGNQAILVVMDSFSKFVAFFPVRNINATMVCDILESWYFTANGLNSSYREEIFKIQKIIIRIIMNSSKNASCRQLFEDLNILRIQFQYIYSIV